MRKSKKLLILLPSLLVGSSLIGSGSTTIGNVLRGVSHAGMEAAAIVAGTTAVTTTTAFIGGVASAVGIVSVPIACSASVVAGAVYAGAKTGSAVFKGAKKVYSYAKNKFNKGKTESDILIGLNQRGKDNAEALAVYTEVATHIRENEDQLTEEGQREVNRVFEQLKSAGFLEQVNVNATENGDLILSREDGFFQMIPAEEIEQAVSDEELEELRSSTDPDVLAIAPTLFVKGGPNGDDEWYNLWNQESVSEEDPNFKEYIEVGRVICLPDSVDYTQFFTVLKWLVNRVKEKRAWLQQHLCIAQVNEEGNPILWNPYAEESIPLTQELQEEITKEETDLIVCATEEEYNSKLRELLTSQSIKQKLEEYNKEMHSITFAELVSKKIFSPWGIPESVDASTLPFIPVCNYDGTQTGRIDNGGDFHSLGQSAEVVFCGQDMTEEGGEEGLEQFLSEHAPLLLNLSEPAEGVNPNFVVFCQDKEVANFILRVVVNLGLQATLGVTLDPEE